MLLWDGQEPVLDLITEPTERVVPGRRIGNIALGFGKWEFPQPVRGQPKGRKNEGWMVRYA